MATSTKYMNWLRRNKIETQDAKKEMVIKVTKLDSRRAVPGCPTKCVLALKLELEPGIKQVHFFNKVAHILRYSHKERRIINYRYSLDAKTKEAIRLFDPPYLQPFQPDNYVLRVISRTMPSETLIAKRTRETKRKLKGLNKNHRNIGKNVKYVSPVPKAFVRSCEISWPIDYTKIAGGVGGKIDSIPSAAV